jgi:hypothetical protein
MHARYSTNLHTGQILAHNPFKAYRQKYVVDDSRFTNRESNLETCGLMEEGADKRGRDGNRLTYYV